MEELVYEENQPAMVGVSLFLSDRETEYIRGLSDKIWCELINVTRMMPATSQAPEAVKL